MGGVSLTVTKNEWAMAPVSEIACCFLRLLVFGLILVLWLSVGGVNQSVRVKIVFLFNNFVLVFAPWPWQRHENPILVCWHYGWQWCGYFGLWWLH